MHVGSPSPMFGKTPKTGAAEKKRSGTLDFMAQIRRAVNTGDYGALNQIAYDLQTGTVLSEGRRVAFAIREAAWDMAYYRNTGEPRLSGREKAGILQQLKRQAKTDDIPVNPDISAVLDSTAVMPVSIKHRTHPPQVRK